MQPGRWVQTVAIPTQQAADGEAVTETVQRWRRDPIGHRQVEREDEPVKRLAGSARMHRACAVEGEQRLIAADRPAAMPSLQLLRDERSDPRSVRHESALAELPAAHDEQVTGRVDVAEAQSARLAGAEPEPVAKREQRPIRRSALRRASVVWEGAGRVEQPAGVDLVEQERDPVRAATPSASARWRDVQQLLADRPVEQAADHAEQMVEAPRPGTGPCSEEVIQQRRREIVQPDRASFRGEANEQPQFALLALILAAQRALVREEPVDRHIDALAVAHESTSSPSPSATSRSRSTATLL